MRLNERIYLVGSGANGFEMTSPLDCHVYLLDGGGELALIDAGAGTEVSAILENVRSWGFDPQRIRRVLLTHPHADHSGGAAPISAATGASVFAPAGCKRLLENADEDGIHLTLARNAGIYPKDYRLAPCIVERELEDGDALKVGDLEVNVLATPGHCREHVSYLVQAGGRSALFSGDSVFYGGKISMINTSDFNLQQYSETARKLAALEIDTLLPGHAMLALRNGWRHLRSAAEIFARMGVPQSIV